MFVFVCPNIPACIAQPLNSLFSAVDDFNLKFKKQSENLKHYEGEHFKIADTRERERERDKI